ncbi:class I adenylate-forming enzyme family protein [Streptomyces sp. NBC_01264]|uniref:class I adenylate-forming enzyme family protein n=1 Tax=Streptomyces sp. NBC_01264 TaxID=2903804 RepID=UPI0022577E08|nr:class I adenylate-forming enzyme family protein [Streptomyces sp. NBC_01264]MCX4781705.1 acyl--CoA ligase [Streptomyces sp. NBC_01264]
MDRSLIGAPDQLLIGDVFANAARAVPDRAAAVMGDRSITFGQLDVRAHRLAALLHTRGLRRGDRVACWSGTDLDLVVLFAALARLGAVFAPVAGTLEAAEAAEVLASLRPALVVAGEGQRTSPVLHTVAPGGGVTSLRELAAAAGTADPAATVPYEDPELVETDPHAIFMTSGSTGRPKGIVLSHRAGFLRSHPGSQLEPRGAAVCTFPLFHMAAWTISLQQWQARDTVVHLARADGAAIREAVSVHRASRLYCVPAVWHRVLEAGPGPLPTLRFADTGTSAVTPALLDSIRAAAPHAHLRVFYGSTEAGNVTSIGGDELLAHPQSAGSPGTSVRIRLDPSGELLVRGPLLFHGYADDPQATEAAFTEGWYRTGDLARLDGAGRITLVGRTGDLIRTGGETVAPAEVEAAITAHPAVADAAVVGLPDPVWGEVVACLLVPQDPEAEPPDLDELRRYLRGNLAAHKHPRLLRVARTLPRTAATGQPRRQWIRAMLQETAPPPPPGPGNRG